MRAASEARGSEPLALNAILAFHEASSDPSLADPSLFTASSDRKHPVPRMPSNKYPQFLKSLVVLLAKVNRAGCNEDSVRLQIFARRAQRDWNKDEQRL